jgi:hypothetical protein
VVLKVVFIETDDNTNDSEVKSVLDLNYPFVNNNNDKNNNNNNDNRKFSVNETNSDILIEKTNFQETKQIEIP